MKKLTVIAAAAVLAAGAPQKAEAKVELPDIFSDHAVLQQQSDARIWGWAKPGSTVTVIPSWSGRKTEVKADPKTGKWSAEVSTPEASYTPYSISVSDSDGAVTLTDVLVGEVWFCSGQSNMEMPLRGYGFQPVEGAGEAIAYSGRYPGIRMASVPKKQAYMPQEKVEGKWKVSNPANAGEFSALAYFYARALTDLLDVPVGIINCSYGGSKAEGWLPKEILDTYPGYDMAREEKDKDVNEYHRIGVMYNAMLRPLAGYTVKGFLWNQGESNVGKHDEYPAHHKDMVEHWRELWGQGELPFYYVEIPGWNYGDPDGVEAALFRESQHKAARIIPNSGIVCTSDLVYPFETDDIHARKKKEIGERLAWMAGRRTYGIEGIPDGYPEFGSVELMGEKAIVKLKNPWNGLNPYADMPGFEVAGADKVFHPAKAVQVQDPADWQFHIEVASPEVKDIKAVRYCFRNFIPGQIHDMLGLPLVPFRSDDWGNGK